MINAGDGTEKTPIQARRELSVIIRRYRANATPPISGSDEHARRAGVSPEAVRYVKDCLNVGEKPSAKDVRSMIRVLGLSPGFHVYALELVTVGYDEVVASATPRQVRKMPRLPTGRERVYLGGHRARV